MLKSYKELTVWNRVIELVREVYKETSKLPTNEIYGLSSQMRRAAASIPFNIAEGQSRKNLKEFLQFLRVSCGYAAELETQTIIAADLFPRINFNKIRGLLDKVQKMLNIMIKN